MSSFTYELKESYLDDFIYKLKYYDNDIRGLKKELIYHYRKTLGKGDSATSQVVGELMNMWTNFDGNHGEAKEEILRIAKFSARYFGHKIAFDFHRAMLVLTFPLIAELSAIASDFGSNIFTYDMLLPKIKGSYGSPETLETSIKKALLTMCTVGIIKRFKRGVYKYNQWPVFNTLGILVTLIAAQAMSNNDKSSINPYMQGISLEITHEFAEYFPQINYPDIVGKNVWDKFVNSSSDYSLQYNDNHWKISNEPFIYAGINLPLSQIPQFIQLSIEDIEKVLKNEKNSSGDKEEDKL